MTPVELLKATQVAAGDGQLTKWHNDLIGRSADQKKANSVSLSLNTIALPLAELSAFRPTPR